MKTLEEIPKRELFFVRELSWLDFNARVLAEASNPRQPLLERIKFLAIFSNNLDEFFMIHVPGMLDRSQESGSHNERTHSHNLESIQARLQPTLRRQYEIYHEIMNELMSHEIGIVPYGSLGVGQKTRIDKYYADQVHPVLTPLIVDPAHPFPYISNKSLSLVVQFDDPSGSQTRFGRVKVPTSSGLPRLVPIDGEPNRFVLLEELITAHLDKLYVGMNIKGCYPCRVTRDGDISLQQSDAGNEMQPEQQGLLIETIEQKLGEHSRYGDVTRVELPEGFPPELAGKLLEELGVDQEYTYYLDGPLNLADLFRLSSLEVQELRDPPLQTSFVPELKELHQKKTNAKGEDIFSIIQKGDILLHHPFQSFESVEMFIEAAANDPNVLAIKHTLYRTTGDSRILLSLVKAADAGKQVACLVELKARFDEENNINWARRLEDAGVHVAYGVLGDVQGGLKTHSKVTLVVRREGTQIRRYLHIGTGNYNPKTARIYTDVGVLTCNPEFGADATDLFNQLTTNTFRTEFRKFKVAPITLRPGFEGLIKREIEVSTPDRPGRIIAKMNGLVDERIILCLYEASRAGVQIDLIVRGMCGLRPGVPGMSENIRVISVIGRFLEHSRIFYFQNGESPEVYIGSADWMSRNLDRRVEVVVPIEDEKIRETLLEDILEVYLRDNCQAWDLGSDGVYTRRSPESEENRFSSQEWLIEQYAQ